MVFVWDGLVLVGCIFWGVGCGDGEFVVFDGGVVWLGVVCGVVG